MRILITSSECNDDDDGLELLHNIALHRRVKLVLTLAYEGGLSLRKKVGVIVLVTLRLYFEGR